MNQNCFQRIALISLVLFSPIFISCSTPEIPVERKPTRSSIPEESSFDMKFTVILTLDSNSAADGVVVRAISAGSSISDSTGRDGAVSLKLPFTSRSSVDFEMKKGTMRWVQTIDSIPAGVRSVRIYFDLSSDGSVGFSRMEY
jgi:hypothetical protein